MASLGAMLKGYGIMAGVGAERSDTRFWWTPGGALAMELAGRDSIDKAAVRDDIFKLKEWAKTLGNEFKKERGDKNTGRRSGDPPLLNEAKWYQLAPELVADAEGVGVFFGHVHRPNPVFANWGQDGSGNLFSTLEGAGNGATESDIDVAIYGTQNPGKKRLDKGGGVLFPDGIKRYATGTDWCHEKHKSVGAWDFILAMRGLLLLRGAVRSPRGSRKRYSAFPFVLPGSAIQAQGKPVATDEIFLPTWTDKRPRNLAEFLAQLRGFQARVGQRDFASGAADFRRAVDGRAVTGAFNAFHRFVLEPRKPGRNAPQTQAITRGMTLVGLPSDVRTSLRFLLAPLDDSGWLGRFSWSGGQQGENSKCLALAKKRFDEAVHAAIDLPSGESRVAVLIALWDMQVTLQKVCEQSGDRFTPAPLLEGREWQHALSEFLNTSPAARLAWALASVGWISVKDNSGQETKKPVIEQVLPVQHSTDSRLSVSDSLSKQRVHQTGRNPTRELATLFWRRWLDTLSLAALPAKGSRPANLDDVVALLCGDVSVRELQGYFLAFLCLDRSGCIFSSVDDAKRPVSTAYAALRLWLELSARPPSDERRPIDGVVPRGIATGTPRSVESACLTALRRLRIAGLPRFSAEENRLPNGKSVAVPNVCITPDQAQLMAAALLVPIRNSDVSRLAEMFFIPSAPLKTNNQSRMETSYV